MNSSKTQILLASLATSVVFAGVAAAQQTSPPASRDTADKTQKKPNKTQKKPNKTQKKPSGTGAMAQIGTESDAPYGNYLVDAKGKTLYMFTPDIQGSKSTCYGACARAWPPVTTSGSPEAVASGLDASKLGTITRTDGTEQVTYAGWPLYYFARDTAMNEVSGQDIHSFGGEWYLLSPNGSIIKETAGDHGKSTDKAEKK